MWYCISNFRKLLIQSATYLDTGNLFLGSEKLFKYKFYKIFRLLHLTNFGK